MTGRVTLTMPYRTLRPNDVVATPSRGWSLRFADSEAYAREVCDGDAVDSWDYLRPFSLERSFAFAPDLPTRLGLGRDTHFQLLVHLSTGKGLHRRAVHAETFAVPREPLRVTLQCDSRQLCRDLKIATLVSLALPVVNADPLAPVEPGHRLWEDAIKVGLEQGRSRLPMEVISFRAAFAGQGFEQALYHVTMAPYPELDLEDAVLVSLNADFPRFVDAVQRHEPTAEALLWDAILQRMLRDSLLDPDFFSNPACAPGSLGATLARWIFQAFPAMSRREAAELLMHDSSRFDATLQSWALTAARIYRREES